MNSLLSAAKLFIEPGGGQVTSASSGAADALDPGPLAEDVPLAG
jgi:hypothetical protein